MSPGDEGTAPAPESALTPASESPLGPEPVSESPPASIPALVPPDMNSKSPTFPAPASAPESASVPAPASPPEPAAASAIAVPSATNSKSRITTSSSFASDGIAKHQRLIPSGIACWGMLTIAFAGAYVQDLTRPVVLPIGWMPVIKKSSNRRARPDEPRRRQRPAAEREAERHLALGRAGRGIVRPVAVRTVRLTPSRELDVDLVRSVLSDARGGPVREEPEDDVLVVDVDGPVDLPLIGAEAQVVGREELRGRPRTRGAGDLQMQVAAAVDRDVARAPVRHPGHPARGDLPRVALPHERRRGVSHRRDEKGKSSNRRKECGARTRNGTVEKHRVTLRGAA